MYNLLCAWDFKMTVDKKQYALAPSAKCITCYVLRTSNMYYQLIKCLLQADLSKKESQIADLQENIKSQQAETSKAKEELTSALTAMEQLKESFKSEWAGWDAEKATVLKQAEDAQTTLKPVAEELSGLKRQINAMTSGFWHAKEA